METILVPPPWTDRDDCFRCHMLFSTFARKHHCRACGETFCATCSSKQSPLREYGIEEDVRVCIPCYNRITTTGSIGPQNSETKKSEEEIKNEPDEEAALELALSLSRSEAEEKERQKKLLTQQYAQPSRLYSAIPFSSAPIADDNVENYLETQTKNDLITIKPMTKNPLDKFVRDEDIDAFVHIVTEHINNIKFRMLSNQQRGRNIGNDTAVQSVFIMLQHMYPELNHFLKLLDEKQSYYENLQDKLNQLKDAREALNALREEYAENKKRLALERERQRQMQLAAKLDDMRQKKQTYLEYQRQLHLQRLAEQEAEMQARLNQQRHFIQQREQQNQMPYIPPTAVTYYHQNLPQLSTEQSSNVLPSNVPTVSSQSQDLYSQQNPPEAASPQPNDQALISFD